MELTEGEKKTLRIQGIDPELYDGGCHTCGCHDMTLTEKRKSGTIDINVYRCRHCGSIVLRNA